MVRRSMCFVRHTKLVPKTLLIAACWVLGVILLGGAAHGAEYKLVQTVYPGKYAPDPLVVKQGERVKILATTKDDEHVNRISILPWVKASETLLPGKITVIEFIPDRVGNFKIRNIGHGFTGTLKVVE